MVIILLHPIVLFKGQMKIKRTATYRWKFKPPHNQSILFRAWMRFPQKKKIWCGIHTTFSYLTLTTIEEYFIISITFTFNLYFLCFVVIHYLLLQLLLIIFKLNFRILPECGCIYLIPTTK